MRDCNEKGIIIAEVRGGVQLNRYSSSWKYVNL